MKRRISRIALFNFCSRKLPAPFHSVVALLIASTMLLALAVPGTALAAGFDKRMLGDDPSRSSWSLGPLAVNLTSGNLTLNIPGPTYPTAIGSMALTPTYNSTPPAQPDPCPPPGPPCAPPRDYSTSPRDSRLGPGITLGAGEGDRRPIRLIDHNLLSDTAQFDAIEVVYSDGASDYFEHSVVSPVYLPFFADGSTLTKKPSPPYSGSSPAWTLIDADGLTAGFDAIDPATGSAPLLTLQTQAAASSAAKLTYSYSTHPAAPPGTLVGISDESGRTLQLDWNFLNGGSCTSAILCATGPDGVTWR
jgi:hypothetical protein